MGKMTANIKRGQLSFRPSVNSKAVIETERLLVSLSMETFTYATKQSGAKTQQQHTEMLFKDIFSK